MGASPSMDCGHEPPMMTTTTMMMVRGAARTRRRSGRLRQDGEDLVLTEDEHVIAFDLDVGAGGLSKQDLVAHLDVERELGSVLEDLAVADGQDLTLLRLLLGGVGDDDPAPGGLLLLDAADEQTVVKRSYFHEVSLSFVSARLRRRG